MNFQKTLTFATALAAGFGMAGIAPADVDNTNRQLITEGGSFSGGGKTISDGDSNTTNNVFFISEDATWSNDNWYNMRAIVVVTNGATLTIEPGTVIASGEKVSSNDYNDGGSLIVATDGKIHAEGTRQQPIIFTSRKHLDDWANDDGHVTGKDPDNQGVWRPGVQEWGSVALLGEARISDTRQNPSNDLGINGSKSTSVEGVEDIGNKDNYGGLDIDDDSGVFRYVQLSYGGEVLGQGDELNGMTSAGVGRGTDLDHIEIYNNVDDGLEIFGGSVNVKHLLVWHIGDDSLDIDQGWRGRTQFTAILQGWADEAGAGSGFGDHGNEFDGVDGDTEGQPQTAGAHYNMTIVGEGRTSDDLIELRDNANMQWFNSIFMAAGNKVLHNGEDDGDGSTGYGDDSTLSYDARWNTSYTHLHDPSLANIGAGVSQADLEDIYYAQTSGNLLQIAGSVFYDNDSSQYTNTDGGAVTSGVLPSGNSGAENATLDNKIVSNSPIQSVTRATSGRFLGDNGSIFQQNVTSVDLRAANAALDSNRAIEFQAPDNGFYTTPTMFRGAVSNEFDWMQDWTGISATYNTGADGVAGNADDEIILDSPDNPSAPTQAISLSPVVSWDSKKDVPYVVVRIAEDGTETVVDSVIGDGTQMTVSDLDNQPLNASARYEVRIQ